MKRYFRIVDTPNKINNQFTVRL